MRAGKRKIIRGFTVIELVIVIALIAMISALIVSTFATYRKNVALGKDTEMIVETLRQARSLTLSSKDATAYGVHFASTTVTLFAGPSYVASEPSNMTFPLVSSETTISVNLAGGGGDVTFSRLSGETTQNGTVTVTVPSASASKTITIYQTGVIDWN